MQRVLGLAIVAMMMACGFAARADDLPCELRLNDFPDENIATLWVRGEKFALDEFPKLWRLPKHRGE